MNKANYPSFEAKTDAQKIADFIKIWFDQNGPTAKAVVGLSGGKDSTVAAALCVKALGRDRVVGVLMPNEVQPDIDDAKAAAAHLGIKYRVVNIGRPFQAMLEALQTEDSADFTITAPLRQNLAPRLRMATLYAVAQGLPEGGRVINTCNRSEDYVGYSTKYGDSAGDVAPLAAYTVDEVIAIGEVMGLPQELVHKAPSDGLCGKTDEDNLGFTYAALDRYIKTGLCEDEAVRANIERRHKLNLHKVSLMPMVER